MGVVERTVWEIDPGKPLQEPLVSTKRECDFLKAAVGER